MPTFVTAHTFCASQKTRVVPTNTGIFLLALKLYGESKTWQVILVSKKKIGGNHALFRDNKASIWKKKKRHTLLCILLLIELFIVA